MQHLLMGFDAILPSIFKLGYGDVELVYRSSEELGD
jgi:hypothetical protein